ncbi:hypothetical protein G9A89_002018 [Geosiphon pyriformis]|nr:hypothetical protein G9A89_002018 [Geosiphon pyriformis]
MMHKANHQDDYLWREIGREKYEDELMDQVSKFLDNYQMKISTCHLKCQDSHGHEVVKKLDLPKWKSVSLTLGIRRFFPFISVGTIIGSNSHHSLTQEYAREKFVRKDSSGWVELFNYHLCPLSIRLENVSPGSYHVVWRLRTKERTLPIQYCPKMGELEAHFAHYKWVEYCVPTTIIVEPSAKTVMVGIAADIPNTFSGLDIDYVRLSPCKESHPSFQTSIKKNFPALFIFNCLIVIGCAIVFNNFMIFQDIVIYNSNTEEVRKV